jgi:hypothetical protein
MGTGGRGVVSVAPQSAMVEPVSRASEVFSCSTEDAFNMSAVRGLILTKAS